MEIDIKRSHLELLSMQDEHEKLLDSEINASITQNNTSDLWGFCIYFRKTIYERIGHKYKHIVYTWPKWEWYMKTRKHLDLCQNNDEGKFITPDDHDNYGYGYRRAVRRKIAPNMYSDEFKEYVAKIEEFSGDCIYYKDICDKDQPVYCVGEGKHKRLVVPLERYDKCDPDVNSEHDVVIYTFKDNF